MRSSVSKPSQPAAEVSLRGVGDGRQVGLEGRIDGPQAVPIDAGKEGVRLDFIGSVAAQALVGRRDQVLDQILRLRTQLDLVGEVQLGLPVENLAVRLVRVFGAEGWPAHQALKHDGPQAPPIAFLAVPGMQKDLGGNVVGRADGRVGHQPPRLSPRVDLVAVGHSEVDGIHHDRVSRPRRLLLGGRWTGAVFEEPLVVGLVVRLMEARRQAEVREFDVAILVDQDVVGFDIPILQLSESNRQLRGCQPTDE